MEKQRKPLSTKKPPVPATDFAVIEDWMDNRILPGIKPIITEINQMIHESIDDLQYAIKWGNAYYGTEELGWVIEVAAYDVSANIVFLKGANYKNQPPLGSGNESRYVKIRSMDELQAPEVLAYIKEAGSTNGWK